VAEPGLYYRENVTKTLDLVDELVRLGRPRVVFSSSASVYAPSDLFEVREDSELGPTSPYARTKMVGELALQDFAAAGPLQVVALRYFNPIGSDPDLISGVHAREPSHVAGQLMRVVRGLQPEFVVTGGDYPTRDGTGIRDYVHVWDVAQAHVSAVESFDRVLTLGGGPYQVLNVGTGVGVTVRELVAAVERVSGRQIPVRTAPARPGDTVGAYADVRRARELLGWTSVHTLDEAIRSALDWGERREDVLGYA
jgi:UDP-glucose 4-epimerase